MKTKITKNYLFYLFNQVFTLVLSVIATPYVARVLTAEKVGVYSYGVAVASYFVVFAVNGTALYSSQVIGAQQTNVKERSKLFWEIEIFRIATTFIALLGYGLLVVNMRDNIFVFLIMSLNILGVSFDISWFFQGIEQFEKPVIINTVVSAAFFVLVFLFVNGPNDLWIYTFIKCGDSFCKFLFQWLLLRKNLVKVSRITPFRHTKTIIKLFIPTLAIQIYTVLDKTMLGWFTDSNVENGYYEQADNIVHAALMLVNALSVVMIPRIALLYEQRDLLGIKVLMQNSFENLWFISLPVFFGLISVSSYFVPVFLGSGYEKVVVLLPILGSLVIVIGFNVVMASQFLVPTKQQGIYTKLVFLGAFVNFAMNLLLIPHYFSIGAAVSTVVAESLIAICEVIYIGKTKQLDMFKAFLAIKKPLLGCAIMSTVLFVEKKWLNKNVFGLGCLIVSGVIIYFASQTLLKSSSLKAILELLKNKTSPF